MLSLFLWKHQSKLLQRALHGGCIIRLRSELIYRFFIVWYSWLYLKIRTLLADTMCKLMLSEHLALTEFWRPRTILSDRLLLYDIWRQVTNPPGILDAKAVGSAPLLRLNSLSRKFLHLLTVCRQPSLRITSFIFPDSRPGVNVHPSVRLRLIHSEFPAAIYLASPECPNMQPAWGAPVYCY